MIKYAFFRPDDDKHDMSIFGYATYYFTNFISMPISFGTLSLSCSLIIQIYNNMTTLEKMGNKQQRIPCIGPIHSDF